MTVKEQIKNALTMSWAKIKSLCVLNSNVVNSTSGTSTTYPLSAAAGADLQNQINELNSALGNMKIHIWDYTCTSDTVGRVGGITQIPNNAFGVVANCITDGQTYCVPPYKKDGCWSTALLGDVDFVISPNKTVTIRFLYWTTD